MATCGSYILLSIGFLVSAVARDPMHFMRLVTQLCRYLPMKWPDRFCRFQPREPHARQGVPSRKVIDETWYLY